MTARSRSSLDQYARALLSASLAGGAVSAVFGGAPAESWMWGLFAPGSQKNVWAAAVVDYGGGPHLFVSGEFAGTSPAGQFGIAGTTAQHVAQWDGVKWSSVGDGFDDTTLTLTPWPTAGGTRLVAGGAFTHSGTTSLSRVGVFDGTAWQPMGSGLDALCWKARVMDPSDTSTLYAVGVSIKSGAGGPSGVAHWSGSDWEAVGALGGTVRDIVRFDDGSGPKLYAGGVSLNSAAGTASVQRWDGSAWTPVGGNFNGTVFGLEVFDDGSGSHLYAGGDFTSNGVTATKRLAEWNGSSWVEVGGGLTDPSGEQSLVLALLTVVDAGQSKLCVAGRFQKAGSTSASMIALWDGQNWSPLGAGVNPVGGIDTPWVRSLAQVPASGPASICAVGTFNTAGGVRVNRVGLWNGSAWRALGSQAWVNGRIDKFKIWNDGSGPVLAATGIFSSVGTDSSTSSVSQTATWDGTTWHPLGGGPGGGSSNTHHGLTVLPTAQGDKLIAVGPHNFPPYCAVCQWDGAAWQDVITNGAQQPDGDIWDAEVFDDGSGPALYVCGDFSHIGGIAANLVAKFDGTSWSALGAGLTNSAGSPVCVTLRTVDPDGSGPLPPVLVAGGNFRKAGTVDTYLVAAWDGSQWSGFGTSMATANTRVQAIGWHDGGSGRRLVIGGNIYQLGTNSFDYLAEWNGSAWVALGNPNSTVLAIENLPDQLGGSLYVGGFFTSVGGVSASCVARLHDTTWQALGAGVWGSSGGQVAVYTLAAFDGVGDPAIYAGGVFDWSNTTPTQFFGAWGIASSPLVQGIDGGAGDSSVVTQLTATVSGSIPLNLQWRRNGVPLAEGGGFSGTTSAVLHIDGGVSNPAGTYDLIAANHQGVTVSDPFTIAPPLIGDMNGDGHVNGADLGVLLSKWGVCADPCPADLNHDGHVDGADLGLLIAHWTG